MTLEEFANRVDDGIAAIERIAESIEAIEQMMRLMAGLLKENR